MPASSADTFWGKGFLATALGTASPDRKKTRKGQTRLTSSSRCDHLGICRKKQRRSAHLMHTRTFLKQGGRRQDTVRRAFPNSLDIDTNQPHMSQFYLLCSLIPRVPLRPESLNSAFCETWFIPWIHTESQRSHSQDICPCFLWKCTKKEHRFTKYHLTSQGKHPFKWNKVESA